MRKKILAGNWKMNLTATESLQLVSELINHPFNSDVHLVIAPNFISLHPISQFLANANNKNMLLGAQNCYYENAGAYTGEVALNMLKEVGVQYVIIGHSERRTLFFEKNELILKKMKAILAQNMTPIFCCGEPLTNRTNNTQNAYVQNQLEETIWMLTIDEVINIVIAYEPIWAIGTGQTASNQQAEEMHSFIRALIANKYGDKVASQVSIIYGGSVNAATAPALMAMPNIDGALVGGASLKANDFIKIYQSF
jgi:triosephosphate isomerase